MDSLAERQAGLAAQPDNTLSPQARNAVWGAAVGFFVDNYDIFLPVIALAPPWSTSFQEMFHLTSPRSPRR